MPRSRRDGRGARVTCDNGQQDSNYAASVEDWDAAARTATTDAMANVYTPADLEQAGVNMVEIKCRTCPRAGRYRVTLHLSLDHSEVGSDPRSVSPTL